MRFAFCLIVLFIPSVLWAQFEFRFKTDVPVSINGQNLERAWEGGLNAAQFQTMDLNNDGNPDLVIYNRISRDLSTYLSINNTYVWQPEFALSFPEDVTGWLILKDYDCDGKKDLFTSTTLGIKVYRNISTNTEILWEEASSFLTFDSGTNIQVNASDIPGIADINGDGALDILTYRFGTSSTVDYFQNTGTCGSLTFTRAERQWGGFEECDCDSFAFGGSACPSGGVANTSFDLNEPSLIQHAGGKTILAFDADNDGDMDIISSDEFCETLYFLENEGNSTNAQMSTVISYPVNDPAAFKLFPSAFLEDIDFDGLEDLIISTNADENIGNEIDLQNNISFYQNSGTSLTPVFDDQAKPFLQHEMIDLGEHVYPAFVDFDNDGDLDLFVGNKGIAELNNFSATIHFFENTGSRFSPAFQLTDPDFLGLKNEGYTHIKPQFTDTNGDGLPDLIYQATLGFADTRFFHRVNTGNFSFSTPAELNIPSSSGDQPFFFDINNDDNVDLILGKQFGSMSVFVNSGNMVFGNEINDFGGFENDFNQLFLSPAVADLNNDGQPELFTLSSSGLLTIYDQTFNLSFSVSDPATDGITNIWRLDEKLVKTAFGIQNRPVTADLFGTGKPAIIIGTSKGGLYILENISSTGSGGDGDAFLVSLAPNPTNDRMTVLADTNGELSLISLLGQTLSKGIEVEDSVPLELRFPDIPNGVYLLRIVNTQNQVVTKRIVITR